TYFVVAHFHLIMVSGTVTAFLAGLHYWFPKLTGRMVPRVPALLAAGLVFAGFVVTFFPQLLLGNAGMPRRYANYPPQYQLLHVVSTLGSWVLASGLVTAAAALLWGCVRGARADNPWHSKGIEWAAASPPPKHNFDRPIAIVDQPHQYWKDEL